MKRSQYLNSSGWEHWSVWLSCVLGCTVFSFIIAEVSRPCACPLSLAPQAHFSHRTSLITGNSFLRRLGWLDCKQSFILFSVPSSPIRFDFASPFPTFLYPVPALIAALEGWSPRIYLVHRANLPPPSSSPQGALLATFLSLIAESIMFLWLRRALLRNREDRTGGLLAMSGLSIFIICVGTFCMVAGTVASVIAINNSLKNGTTTA